MVDGQTVDVEGVLELVVEGLGVVMGAVEAVVVGVSVGNLADVLAEVDVAGLLVLAEADTVLVGCGAVVAAARDEDVDVPDALLVLPVVDEAGAEAGWSSSFPSTWPASCSTLR